MQRLAIGVALAFVLSGLGIVSAQIGAAAGGAAVLTRRQMGNVKYRLIDGALAKKIDNMCAMLWFDDDEVLLVEYRGRSYMIRTNSIGNVGLACKVP
jgi:hypothetical protein